MLKSAGVTRTTSSNSRLLCRTASGSCRRPLTGCSWCTDKRPYYCTSWRPHRSSDTSCPLARTGSRCAPGTRFQNSNPCSPPGCRCRSAACPRRSVQGSRRGRRLRHQSHRRPVCSRSGTCRSCRSTQWGTLSRYRHTCPRCCSRAQGRTTHSWLRQFRTPSPTGWHRPRTGPTDCSSRSGMTWRRRYTGQLRSAGLRRTPPSTRPRPRRSGCCRW